MTPSLSVDEYAARFEEEPGYLDFSRVGPVGRTVQEELSAQYLTLARARFGSLDGVMDQGDRVNAAVGALTGFRPDQIVFQPNTSQGLMHVMFGITGGVAVSPAEFPSLTFAATRAARSQRTTPSTIRPASVIRSARRARIRRRSRARRVRRCSATTSGSCGWSR